MSERSEFLADVVVCAIEGGIDYWADHREYKLTYEDNGMSATRATPALVSATAEIREHESHDGSAPSWHKLDGEKIEEGIRLIVDGQVQIARTVRNDIYDASMENDAGNIDALGADCIVQAAVFGQLIYG